VFGAEKSEYDTPLLCGGVNFHINYHHRRSVEADGNCATVGLAERKGIWWGFLE
jgi:hypothetical protein